MDTSPSNPFRSGRNLLVLFGVVLAGAVAALVIEHAIGAMRDGSEASAATAAIEPELRSDMEFLAERALVARCVGQRLDALETKLLAATDGKWTPLPPATTKGIQAGEVMPVPMRPWSVAAWTAEGDAHFDGARRALYADLYRRIDRATELNADEFVGVAQLNVLGKPVTLSGDAVAELVEQIEAERARNRLFALNAIEAMQAWTLAGRDQSAVVKAIRQKSPAVNACMGKA